MGQGLSRPRKVQAPEPRFCPNPPLRRGGGTAQGRMSRDAAASTIRAHTQGTRPALVGAFSPRRPCMNPLPCQDLPRNLRFFSRTPVRRSTAPKRSGSRTRPSGVHLTRWCTREPANRRPRPMGRYRAIVPAPYIGPKYRAGTIARYRPISRGRRLADLKVQYLLIRTP